MLGVNLSGAEWGDETLPGQPGRHYTFHSERSYRYWASKGLGLIRLAFRWERLQPELRGPLEPAHLALLRQSARWAQESGVKLIIQPHNFGRYRIFEGGRHNEYIIDDDPYWSTARVTRHDFADLWARLSQEFRGDAGIHGYDLMNEPHDMGRGDWRRISQCAVDAIRASGDARLILVPGDDWSSAAKWSAANGPSSWIADPANNFQYEAHCYFDREGSGAYKHTYDEEAAVIPDLPHHGQRRVAPFIEWCRANGVRGYLGEVGAPWDDARWLTVLDNTLETVTEAGMDATYWAAGEWWEGYRIGIQPLNNFTVDRPQVALLQKHLAPGWVATNSVESGSGCSFAPGSLVSATGPNVSGDARIELTDSAGAVWNPPIFSASPGRVEYLIPAGLAPGLARIRILPSGGAGAEGVFAVEG
jgi:endoglucanase